MNLPVLQAGMAVLADQINQISREVRSNAITSFVGGSFQRTSGGTSVQVDPTFYRNNNDAAICPFKVTAYSAAAGEQSAKVKVAQWQVLNRWPDGMGLGYSDFLLNVTETCYVYCQMVFKDGDVILESGSSAITIFNTKDLMPNDTNNQYVLLAIVNLTDGKITSIQNNCVTVVPNACLLNWSDSTPA
jgi:hypothetical protein